MNEGKNGLSRLADRLAVYLYRNGAVFIADCPHCDTTHDVPMRAVTVYVTRYARKSFTAVSCPNCGRVVARDEKLETCEFLLNAGAKFRVFHELPQLTDSYISQFVEALEQGDVIELAKGNR